MLPRLKHILQPIMPALGSVILAMLLVACGGSGSSASSPTPKPLPTPTPIPVTPFTGNGYTINYPQAWKTTSAFGNVSFTDSTAIYRLNIILTPDPNGLNTANALADTAITGIRGGLKNPQTENVAPTTTVGGETWSQRSASGMTTQNGQSVVVQVVVIVDIHPASSPMSKGFIIVYSTTKALFVQANTTYFQPMLQSFKFT